MKYEINAEGELLVARAWGEHSSVEELRQYGADLVSACIVGASTKALLDERELLHTLSEGDIYRLAEQYALRAPRLVKAAILYNPKESVNVNFWETCAVNRGLSVRVFIEKAHAMAWLNGDDGDALEDCA
jgi:hypothetical protein